MKRPHSFNITRHYRHLTEKQTADLIETVAEMIVAFVKARKIDRPAHADPSPPIQDTPIPETGRN